MVSPPTYSRWPATDTQTSYLGGSWGLNGLLADLGYDIIGNLLQIGSDILGGINDFLRVRNCKGKSQIKLDQSIIQLIDHSRSSSPRWRIPWWHPEPGLWPSWHPRTRHGAHAGPPPRSRPEKWFTELLSLKLPNKWLNRKLNPRIN